MSLRNTLLAGLLQASIANLVLASQVATVSPGGLEQSSRIGETCPTFSWGAVPAAERYELAIFDGSWNDSPRYDEQAMLGDPLGQAGIAAPALSWTPAEDDCLADGGRYL